MALIRITIKRVLNKITKTRTKNNPHIYIYIYACKIRRQTIFLKKKTQNKYNFQLHNYYKVFSIF